MEYFLKRLWHALAGLRAGKQQTVDRRSESRLPAHGSARIRWHDEGAFECNDVVSLLGVSTHGLSFRSAQDLKAEQKIVVEADEGEFEVVVRHSAPDGQEFIIGAEIVACDGKPLEPPSDPAAAQVVDEA